MGNISNSAKVALISPGVNLPLLSASNKLNNSNISYYKKHKFSLHTSFSHSSSAIILNPSTKYSISYIYVDLGVA